MPKLYALSPVNHDGVEVAEGEAFEVKNAKQAEALVAAGAAEDAEVFEAKKKAAAAESKKAAKE